MYQTSPKVFISYSWHPNENKERVEQFAQRLTDDGIYVVIDMWDLHAGQDKNAYMEKMVSDESVDKVLLICNKEYAAKANSRKGGVGIESTIVSEEVYKNAEQTKFIPIIFERDEDGNAYMPVFLKSRLHYDLSDEYTFEKVYDELLRDLYKKPKSHRPPLGKMPESLKEDTPSNLPTAHKVSAVRKSIMHAETNITILIEDYLTTFLEALKGFKIDHTTIDNNTFISAIEDSIERMQPLKHDFIDFVLSICTSKDCTGKIFIDFFERWLQWYEDERISLFEDNSILGVANDNYRFFNYDVFLSFATVMLNNGRYDVLYDVVTSHFYIEKREFRVDGVVPFRYTAFRKYNYTLDQYKNERYNLRKVSITANLVSQYAKQLTMQALIQTDILLYYLSNIFPTSSLLERTWFPTTSCYNRKIEVLPKLISKRYFEQIKVLFGVNTPEEFKQLIDNTKEEHIQREYYIIPQIKSGLLYDKICTMD